MFTKRFWLHALEHVIGRMAVTLIAVIGTDQAVSAWSLDYSGLAGVALAAGLLSVLGDLATVNLGSDKGTPRVSR